MEYKDWKENDLLRVVYVEKDDPFEVGGLVIHKGPDGQSVSYCKGVGHESWAMLHDQLEFYGRLGGLYSFESYNSVSTKLKE
jgi:hypothetical protein